MRNDKKSPQNLKRINRPIVIRGSLNMSDEISNNYLPIKLKMSLIPDHLRRLCDFLLKHPNDCVEQILRLILPHSDRSIKIGKGIFTSLLKEDASRLYALFYPLCKKSLEECPDYFQNLIKYIHKNEGKDNIIRLEKDGKIDPLELTIYCIEKINKTIGIQLYETKSDSESFYIKYIVPSLKKAKAELANGVIKKISMNPKDDFSRIPKCGYRVKIVKPSDYLPWERLLDHLETISKGMKITWKGCIGHRACLINFPDRPKILFY